MSSTDRNDVSRKTCVPMFPRRIRSVFDITFVFHLCRARCGIRASWGTRGAREWWVLSPWCWTSSPRCWASPSRSWSPSSWSGSPPTWCWPSSSWSGTPWHRIQSVPGIYCLASLEESHHRWSSWCHENMGRSWSVWLQGSVLFPTWKWWVFQHHCCVGDWFEPWRPWGHLCSRIRASGRTGSLPCEQ